MRILLTTAALLVVAVTVCACGPREGDPCTPSEDLGAECVPPDVLLCRCDAPVGGRCPDDVGTWHRDPACSCTYTSMTCA